MVGAITQPGRAVVEGMSVEVAEGGEVTRIGAKADQGDSDIGFAPGFPNLVDLAPGDTATGRWTFRITGLPITGGVYRSSRHGDRVTVELDVTEP